MRMFDVSPPPAIRAIAFYLPQYHPVPENDAFWGNGFTEWRNVAQAKPRYRGHNQPHLPADLGFYDLRLPEVRAAQADMARTAGLSGFCYYHYWFQGRRLLNRPFDEVLQGGSPDFPFMLCWANENWTRAWDGGAREILLKQQYSDADTVAHARHLIPAFADPRYIRIDSRPVFAIYNTEEIPCPHRWSDLFRQTILKDTGIEPYLIQVQRHLDANRQPPRVLGFDAALDFQPFSRNFTAWQRTRPDLKRNLPRRVLNRLRCEWRRFQPWRDFDTYHDLAAYIAFDICQEPPDYLRFPGVCPSWDNSARRPPGKAIVFHGSSPSLYADWLAAKVNSWRAPSPDENLLFINAWNEWAEGNHLEPCLDYEDAWLRMTKAGLSRLTRPVSGARSSVAEQSQPSTKQSTLACQPDH